MKLIYTNCKLQLKVKNHVNFLFRCKSNLSLNNSFRDNVLRLESEVDFIFDKLT